MTSWLIGVGGRSIWSRISRGRSTTAEVRLASMDGVLAVSNTLWRGPAPSADGYAELAQAGVRLIIDLRAEADLEVSAGLAEAHRMHILAVPIANGQSPGPHDLARVENRMASTDGITYVHCEAGEGRTGAVIGGHQVALGDSVLRAITEQLAVGSLTIAQMAYVATAGQSAAVVWLLDRLIDRPTEALFDLTR